MASPLCLHWQVKKGDRTKTAIKTRRAQALPRRVSHLRTVRDAVSGIPGKPLRPSRFLLPPLRGPIPRKCRWALCENHTALRPVRGASDAVSQPGHQQNDKDGAGAFFLQPRPLPTIPARQTIAAPARRNSAGLPPIVAARLSGQSLPDREQTDTAPLALPPPA